MLNTNLLTNQQRFVNRTVKGWVMGGPLEAAMGCPSGTLLGFGGFSQWQLLDTAIERKIITVYFSLDWLFLHNPRSSVGSFSPLLMGAAISINCQPHWFISRNWHEERQW